MSVDMHVLDGVDFSKGHMNTSEDDVKAVTP